MMKMYVGMNYVNGDFCKHRPDFSSLNPSTNLEIGCFQDTQGEEVSEAVEAAHKAFLKWRNVSRVQRADYFDKLSQLLKRNHDKLVHAISLETGKNTNESHAEVIEALHMCQVAAASGRQPFGEVIASELSTKDAYVLRKPKGVVAVISPWNFPLAIGSFWCSAPAIVEGNCVVHKPSEYTPMVAQLVAELYDEAGFPPGVYNLIHGLKETGKQLVRDPKVDVILFTGSAAAGQDIRKHCAETWHKTCSIECGSKSAVLVFDDADMELALNVTVPSAFKLSGQRCVSSGRMLVQRGVYEDFKNSFVEKVKSDVTTGDPFDNPAPYYGPLIDAVQAARVENYNTLVALDKDAQVLLPGTKLNPESNYMTPFVYTCEWGDKKYLKEEVFGPHVAIIPFDTVEDGIRIYNDTDYGLSCGIVTESFRTMRKCRDECKAGMVYLNGSSIGAESHLPFGGVGKSGNGWKTAIGTYRAVTEEVAVTVNYEEGNVKFAQGMK